MAILTDFIVEDSATMHLAVENFDGEDFAGFRGEVIIGTERPDEIFGTAADDTIRGRGGNDVISGEGGNDVIYGGPGNDIIFNNEGLNTIFGNGGNDQLFGGGGDTLSGGRGNDGYILDTSEGIVVISERLSGPNSAGGTDTIFLDIELNDIGIRSLGGNSVLLFSKSSESGEQISSGVLIDNVNDIEFLVPLDFDVRIELSDIL